MTTAIVSDDGEKTMQQVATFATSKYMSIRRGSIAHDLLGRLFFPPQVITTTAAAAWQQEQSHHMVVLTLTKKEVDTMYRLLKAGLVAKPTRQEDRQKRYSITPAGRAHCVAAWLGLSFPQLCYLAIARVLMKKSLFAEIRGFHDRDLHAIFSTIFVNRAASITRGELARKGFLSTCTSHVSVVGPRFEELEQHAAVMDELHTLLQKEYGQVVINSSLA